MISHLTEDQISRWFIGQSSATEQRHVQVCRACTAELEHFLSAVGSFKTAMTFAGRPSDASKPAQSRDWC